ncbi:MAG: hypothetical protein R3292_14765 [Alcanivorax sp.]|nr:hypothetical protein [Alcanivorax sp.]
MDKFSDQASPRHDIFLGYVVQSTQGEFLAACSKAPSAMLPTMVSYPAWAHRYSDLTEAEADAAKFNGEVAVLCDSLGRHTLKRCQ